MFKPPRVYDTWKFRRRRHASSSIRGGFQRVHKVRHPDARRGLYAWMRRPDGPPPPPQDPCASHPRVSRRRMKGASPKPIPGSRRIAHASEANFRSASAGRQNRARGIGRTGRGSDARSGLGAGATRRQACRANDQGPKENLAPHPETTSRFASENLTRGNRFPSARKRHKQAGRIRSSRETRRLSL